MNGDTHERLDWMVAELVGRGLPADYAQRAVAELNDHRRDLVEELQAAGQSESQALTEAARRLGDSRLLVRNTVRSYQLRFWCGRWPLITFLLAPIPLLVLTSGWSAADSPKHGCGRRWMASRCRQTSLWSRSALRYSPRRGAPCGIGTRTMCGRLPKSCCQ